MKPRLIAASICAGALAWLIAQTAQSSGPLAPYFPAGASIFVEVWEFSRVLTDWDASPEKAAWLKSDNYRAFSNSRLLLRLTEAQTDFATVAAIPPDMPLVRSVAGGRSAIAIYDIGNLEFLYVSRLAVSQALQTALFGRRSSYESRNAAGKPYYVRTDPKTRRTVAFAATDDLLILGTREDLVAGALTLNAGQQLAPLAKETWYVNATQAARAEGELRIVMNIAELLKSPYFRSYWIQRNRSELAPYSAAISDTFRESARIREERIFLRAQPGEASTDDAAVAQVLAYVPDGIGLYRAWSAPALADIIRLLRSKVVDPGPQTTIPMSRAPMRISLDDRTGDESDLETRIDVAPLPTDDQTDALADFRAIAASIPLDAALHLQSSRPLPGDVFVGNESAIVLLAARDWPAAQVRPAIPTGFVHSQGRILVIADTEPMLKRVVAKLGAAPTNTAVTYAARYDHARELAPFTRMMRLIDSGHSPTFEGPSAAREPNFFSENVASFGRVMNRIRTVSINARDTGVRTDVAVVYELTQ